MSPAEAHAVAVARIEAVRAELDEACQVARLTSLVLEGLTQTQVCEVLGVSLRTVRRRYRLAGLEAKPGRPRGRMRG